MSRIMSAWLQIFLAILLTIHASGEAAFTLNGIITDISGTSVGDAEVYLYRTTNTRRPADFISPKTSNDGRYRLVVPAGTYWAVARIKQGERYGPLQTGQRHSGEPVQIIAGEEPVTSVDFTVADLREMALKQLKGSVDAIIVSGIIRDQEGKPVANAYGYARREQLQASSPEFISAWTGTDGRFTLQLPSGDYFWGAAREFPAPTVPSLTRARANDGAEITLTVE
jgi:hypothetical protein